MTVKYVEAFYLGEHRHELNLVTDAAAVGNYRLYWTYDNDPQTTDKMFLLESDQKQLVFEFTCNPGKRNYFIIEFQDHQPLLFGHRILPVPGMYNLRDIGGYPTESGKRLRWGVGYRSDYFAMLEDTGLEYVQNLGIKTIIDFRSEAERAGFPNRDIGGGAVTYGCDPNAHTAAVAGGLHNNDNMKDMERLIAEARAAVRENPHAGDEKMIRQQLSFISSPESICAYQKTLALISSAKANPSVQHCRGGKDRTGFALMLLEGILGVPRETIIYDYMLTKWARAEKNERYYQKYLEVTGDEATARYMFSFFDTKADYIEASLNQIEHEFGTVRNYAKEILQVDDAAVKRLEDIFLERS